jgi:hypothetical protein
MNIRQVMTDPKLFGQEFSGESWEPWRTLLAGFYGLTLDRAEADGWYTLTQRPPPHSAHNELWLVVGRRGGKSLIAALLAIYESAFCDYQDTLAAGEVATVLVISADRKQARTVFRYISGLLHANPMTERMIVREDRESIELSNRTVIEIGTASFRSIRGYTLAAVICDEIAFWRTEESANPDTEILTALRPALASLAGKLIALSSPYARRGELWKHYRRYFAQENPILVAQAPSRRMNPTLPERFVQQAKERDFASAMAEYEAQFRADIESFMDSEQLQRLVRSEPLQLPPEAHIRYSAFVDPSGGGADGFALAIGHKEPSGRVIVDCLVERTQSNPAGVCREFSHLLNQYQIKEVYGDRYAGQWVATEFHRHGIQYHYSNKYKSELYLDALANFHSGRVELPPSEKLLYQFQNLERRTHRGGRDIIDHPPGLHDDLANAVAGLITTANEPSRRMVLVQPIAGFY